VDREKRGIRRLTSLISAGELAIKVRAPQSEKTTDRRFNLLSFCALCGFLSLSEKAVHDIAVDGFGELLGLA
jgi:hypothetical protein